MNLLLLALIDIARARDAGRRAYVGGGAAEPVKKRIKVSLCGARCGRLAYRGSRGAMGLGRLACGVHLELLGRRVRAED